MDDAFRVGERESAADGFGNADCLVQRQAMAGSLRNQIFYVAAGKQRQHDVWPAIVVAEVINGHDVRVIPEVPHRLGIALDAGAGIFVELFSFDLSESDIPVENGIVDKVNPFLASLAEQLPDPVPAGGKGNRFGLCSGRVLRQGLRR
jgi:hypothetical protein